MSKEGELGETACQASHRDPWAQFPLYDWTYRTVPGTGGSEVGFEWYGSEDEEVMVCAHVGRSLHEKFHIFRNISVKLLTQLPVTMTAASFQCP